MFSDKTIGAILIRTNSGPCGNGTTMLSNIHRALKEGGFYFMQDIKGSSRIEKNMDNPLAPFLFTVSCTHCMTVSLAQGGKGLGAMWGGELACEMLRRSGV